MIKDPDEGSSRLTSLPQPPKVRLNRLLMLEPIYLTPPSAAILHSAMNETSELLEKFAIFFEA